MDSGNSGSMQSSSGGDEEYDSRAETISPFLNHPSAAFGSISNHPQPPAPPSVHHNHSPTLFDPAQAAHNLGTLSHSSQNPNPNALYNLDLVWSRGLRSEPEPNYTGLGNFTASASSSQSLLALQGGPNQGPSSMQLPPIDGNGGRVTTPRPDQSNATATAKSSRKRTRASRRAPTTVLTTDTSNFRQMVQEFTGIPAPPFSAASPYSRRLDLFGAGSALRSGLESLGPLYPFRPSAQKVQIQPSPPPPPFLSSSSSSLLNSNMIDAIAPNPNTTSMNTSLSSDLGLLPKQPQTMLNMQNQMLSYQSLLQSQAFFGSKSQGSSSIPTIDELGVAQEHVNSNPNPSLTGFSRDNNNSGRRWRREEGSSDVGLGANNGSGSQNVGGSFKLNCDKGMENVSSRNEGTFDSWICPSE